MREFKVGEYIVYVNGDIYELGRIKKITEDGAFVAYHEGETGAMTSFDLMHKLINAYCIKETTLGGEFFKEVGIVRCMDCKHSKNCIYPAKWNWCPDGERRTE